MLLIAPVLRQCLRRCTLQIRFMVIGAKGMLVWSVILPRHVQANQLGSETH